MSSKKPAPVPLPRPNGYDDFVKAGPLLKGNLDKYNKLDRAQLGVLVTNNEDALKVLETGLQHQCRVPGDYVWDQRSGAALMPQLADFRRAAELFAAEGKLAELEGRTNDAAHFYLEGIRFGEESGRGGMFSEKLTGDSCSSVNAVRLEKIVSSLNAKQCAQIATKLEAMDASAETDDELLDHENAFVDKYLPFSQKLDDYILVHKMMFKTKLPKKGLVLAKLHVWPFTRRWLMLTFASRAYELEHGKPPANAAELVPEYLKKIPQDSANGTNLNIQH
jgi:hypothetical protein